MEKQYTAYIDRDDKGFFLLFTYGDDTEATYRFDDVHDVGTKITQLLKEDEVEEIPQLKGIREQLRNL